MISQRSKQAVHLGVDIGGTKMEVGLFDKEFNQIDSWRLATPTNSYVVFLSTLTNLIKNAEAKANTSLTIGIGMPGILDRDNLVKSANVQCATGKPIVNDLIKALGKKVTIGNDCRLFALSEANGGSADKASVMYGAIIGTGAGGGLCLNGKLYTTTNNISGEYGHLPVSGHLLEKYKLPVRPCNCGLTGCAESYIAGPGLAWLYLHFGGTEASTYKLVEALNNNEPQAKLAFDCYIDLLGSSMASLILSYDPDIIVIGGGLSKIDRIFDTLPAATANHLFDGVQLPLIKKALHGDSSGVRGAAILGAQNAD